MSLPAVLLALSALVLPALARAQVAAPCPPIPVPVGTAFDQTDESTAEMDVMIAGLPTEHLMGSGATMTRIIQASSSTVQTELLQLDITGTASFGPWHITLTKGKASAGRGKLNPDTGRIDSFFDVFFDVTVVDPNGVQHTFSNLQQPAHLDIVNICPVHGSEQIVAQQRAGEVITLFGAAGPVGTVTNIKHIITPPPPPPCFPPAGTDVMESTLLHDIDIVGIGLCEANLAGPVTVQRSDPYIDPVTGLACIKTKIIDLNLQGVDPVCGRICITLNPFKESTGLICEKEKGTCFPANSCFNVYVKVQLKDLGICLYACEPAVMCCMINTIPPFGCLYNLNIGRASGPVPLYRGSCDPAVADDPCALQPLPPPIAYIVKAVHQPTEPTQCKCYPLAGDDSFVTTLGHFIDIPGINLHCSNFQGPVVVRRSDPYIDPATGLCCIKTEIVQLEMKGTCDNGTTVVLRLCPRMPSKGLICEKTKGTCFPANSCFEVFFEVVVAMADGTTMVFKNCKPAIMCCMIDALPPLGCSYQLTNPPIELYKVVAGKPFPCNQTPLPPLDGLLRNADHTPTDPLEPCCPEYGPGIDIFESNLLHDIEIPGIGICHANLKGPVTVARGKPYVDPTTGLCCVEVFMKDLNLQGVDPICGRICIVLDPNRPSKGRICQKQPGACFPANSCFNMFVRVILKDLNKVYVACEPARMCCMINGIPPIDCLYNLDIGTLGRVPLYEAPTSTQVGAGGGLPSTCEVADNGTGTVTLPPPGCEYLSPEQVHMIIDGLPAGTTIQLSAIHRDFICNRDQGSCPGFPVDCSGTPGGSLGGEMEKFCSTLVANLQGTGSLSTFHRTLNLPGVQCETHIAPRMRGDPVQSFDTDMFRVQGQINGDPDFDLLRIVAGTGFGLPSPGHTTLTRMPSGNWNVDSFFDITYRIDFVGAPGGRLGGMSGSTTGTIRMATGGGAGQPTDPCAQPAPTPAAFIIKAVHQPVVCAPDAPAAGDDTMPSELAHRIRIPGAGPGGGDLICDADMRGPVVVRRGPPHIDPVTGRCTIDTEIVSMELTGVDPVCGRVMLRESPSKASLGKIMQQGAVGGSMFPADSFFDIFVEVSIPDKGLTLQNCSPARMECNNITAVPPINCVYELNLSNVQLYKAGDCTLLEQVPRPANIKPVGAIEVAQHIPRTPCPCPYGPGTDTMDSLLRHDIVIFGAGGRDKLCTAPLTGLVVVERGEPYETTDAAGNKLCCVSTRMLKMDLAGTDPTCGDVKIRLCPDMPSRGQICQMMPGACFPATSCFDVFIEVEVMGMILKNCKPIKMCCKIDTIPPFGCVYLVDPGPDPLLLFKKGDCGIAGAVPVGQINRAEHIPQPPCDPPVPFTSISCVGPDAAGAVTVKWDNNPQCPCKGRVQVVRTNPDGTTVVIPVSAGGTSITDVPDPRPYCTPLVGAVTFKYCVQCLSSTGTVDGQACCEVTVICPPQPCVDCIESVHCQAVSGTAGDFVVITWTYKPNCQPPCDKILISYTDPVSGVAAVLGSVPGTATEFRTPCKPGTYCIQCVCADGTVGAPHCCEPITTCKPVGGRRVPADCNGSGKVDLSDGICLLNFLFQGTSRLPCGETANDPGNIVLMDTNGSGGVDLSDAIRIFGWLFLGLPAPVSCIDPQCTRCIPIPDCPERCPAGQ